MQKLNDLSRSLIALEPAGTQSCHFALRKDSETILGAPQVTASFTGLLDRTALERIATPQAQLSTTRSPIRTVPGAATTAYTPAHGYWPRSPTCSLLCRTSVRRTSVSWGRPS